MSGSGVLRYKESGRVFMGTFVEGKKIDGELTNPDGKKYVGPFENEKQHGKNGTCYYPDGKVYQGEWVNGHRTGFGKMTKPDGSYYEGQWLDDQYHGRGTLYQLSGRALETDWEKGK